MNSNSPHNTDEIVIRQVGWSKERINWKSNARWLFLIIWCVIWIIFCTKRMRGFSMMMLFHCLQNFFWFCTWSRCFLNVGHSLLSHTEWLLETRFILLFHNLVGECLQGYLQSSAPSWRSLSTSVFMHYAASSQRWESPLCQKRPFCQRPPRSSCSSKTRSVESVDTADLNAGTWMLTSSALLYL